MEKSDRINRKKKALARGTTEEDIREGDSSWGERKKLTGSRSDVMPDSRLRLNGGSDQTGRGEERRGEGENHACKKDQKKGKGTAGTPVT